MVMHIKTSQMPLILQQRNFATFNLSTSLTMPVFSPTPAYTVNDFKKSSTTERENGDVNGINSEDLSQSTMNGAMKVLEQPSSAAGTAEHEARRRMNSSKASPHDVDKRDKKSPDRNDDFGHGPTHADALPTDDEKAKSSFQNGHVVGGEGGEDNENAENDKDIDERGMEDSSQKMSSNGRTQETSAQDPTQESSQGGQGPTVGIQKKQHAEGTTIDDEWEAKSKEVIQGMEPHAENRDSENTTSSMGVAKNESRQAQMPDRDRLDSSGSPSDTPGDSPNPSGKRRAAMDIDNYMQRAKRVGILEKHEVPAELLGQKRPVSEQQSGPQTFRTDDRAAPKDSTGGNPLRKESTRKEGVDAADTGMDKKEMVNDEGSGRAKEMESRLARDRAARGQYDANARSETGRGGNFQVGEEGKIFDDWNGKST